MSESILQTAPAWVRLAARLIRWMPAGRYRAIERLCRRPPKQFRMRMPRALGGQWFWCDLRDSIAREVCFTGRYEPQETAVVRAVLKSGMTFVDVGANWGYFTLLAAYLVGANGRILSLEPDPRLFRILQANVAMNQLRQVQALQLAAGAVSGWLTLAGFDETHGNFGLSRVVQDEADHSNLFRVPAQPLDHVMAEAGLEVVDLLKMDIEGAEGFALLGMREALSHRRVRRLLLELHPHQLVEHGRTAAEIIQQLRECGYVGWRIDHSSQGNRRAAYHRHTSLREILRLLDPSRGLDPWPHLMWVSPETELPW